MPDGIDADVLLIDLRDRFGITFAPGQGPLKGRILRIGHIGFFDVFDITTALAGLELGLAEAERTSSAASPSPERSRPTSARRLDQAARPDPGEQIAEAGIDLLRERFDVDVDTNSDLAATIGDYEAIVVRSATKLDADLIARRTG